MKQNEAVMLEHVSKIVWTSMDQTFRISSWYGGRSFTIDMLMISDEWFCWQSVGALRFGKLEQAIQVLESRIGKQDPAFV